MSQAEHNPTLQDFLAHALGGPGLPSPLPDDPAPLLVAWYHEAVKKLGDEVGTAMSLATSTPDGRPSTRVVLCKAIEPSPLSLSFFTNYQSRKASELDANPAAAAVFYWPALDRQVRLEGRAERLGDRENDAYFATRSLASRLGAWVSDQSRPLASRADLLQRVGEVAARLGVKSLAEGQAIPRPPHWGGYRLRVHAVELWVAGRARLHDRAQWRRDPATPGSPWLASRLFP
jgi:pyridoxamine 5'-phosphate oxidase